MNRVTITYLQHKGPGVLNAYLCKLIDADSHIGANVPVLATNKAEASKIAWACFEAAVDKNGYLDIRHLGVAQ